MSLRQRSHYLTVRTLQTGNKDGQIKDENEPVIQQQVNGNASVLLSRDLVLNLH